MTGDKAFELFMVTINIMDHPENKLFLCYYNNYRQTTIDLNFHPGGKLANFYK